MLGIKRCYGEGKGRVGVHRVGREDHAPLAGKAWGSARDDVDTCYTFNLIASNHICYLLTTNKIINNLMFRYDTDLFDPDIPYRVKIETREK